MDYKLITTFILEIIIITLKENADKPYFDLSGNGEFLVPYDLPPVKYDANGIKSLLVYTKLEFIVDFLYNFR